MKSISITTILILFVKILFSQTSSVLVETENFDEKGGWVVDQQFTSSMGSPYLLAHGMGEPVENAITTVDFPESGRYWFWVRTKDWVPTHPETPGTFKIIFDNKEYPETYGVNEDWQWIRSGRIKIGRSKTLKIELKDETGFEGRCDAIYFSKNKNDFPPVDLEEMTAWRKEKLGIPPPELQDEFDLVVIGGGLAGCGAAVAAARQGIKVALINDRPVLGGNASKEIRVHTLGLKVYNIVEELGTEHYPNGDSGAIAANDTIEMVVRGEENITVFPNTRAFTVHKKDNKITAVDCFHTHTHKEIRFEAPLFVDATGDGWIGYWAGAEVRMGREARDEFNESMAPEQPDNMTMGNTILWNSVEVEGETPRKFEEKPRTLGWKEVLWAMDVAKDYKAKRGEWFWEYGMLMNTIYDAEEIRDHMFRAIYGNWYNVKQDPENANLKLKWIAYVAGKRESRRIVGDYILKESDIVNHPDFEDGFVEEVREIDIHYPKGGKYDFLSYADFTRIERYKIPYRCFYSKDIDNLFMAGRCFSATHVGLGSPRVMHTTTQMGVVVGTAAVVCTENDCSPRDVYHSYLSEMKSRLDKMRIEEKTQMH
ncbi:FAD-dependent oxidoreductase [Maribellus comscasis]|uniref:FAD-dependent oxidoreductase n=1 Tax=Maribellus comscasis TaxID=2681766 RepID=A0A6I6K223_9BACT|nr:FAD-dependent oxidoreductase [Maribellus comscasis]QGY47508.1 FAD-dependent oxidoreductase [Maribellus comscasis]